MPRPLHFLLSLTPMALQLRSIRSLLHYRLFIRNLSSSHDASSIEWENLRGKSAYEVLGVSQSSSFSEIKSSFAKLAKQTHPDCNGSNSAASHRFLQILAAYEILSDSKKRSHYDTFLYSHHQTLKSKPKSQFKTYPPNSLTKESNVVEWLKWYRLTIDDIITHKRISNNSTYIEILENELHSAIQSAYFGPKIESLNLLPDCFEAEERSILETNELLHLVSGRDLFGIVYIVNDNGNKITKLPHTCDNNNNNNNPNMLEKENCMDICQQKSDLYEDLELHICGKLVARANRRQKCDCIENIRTGTESEEEEDHIHVFLVPDELDGENIRGRERILLGTITSMETSGEEGSCTVFDARGVKTHIIMKHRTLLVKHMHWYRIGNEVSICECRSSRAKLPPSRYWLFEPRCYMHDIGGWYIETFGKDMKGKTVLSPRQWDSFTQLNETRLHPAMYLMALAYRSLDIEEAKRRKWSLEKINFIGKWYKYKRSFKFR